MNTSVSPNTAVIIVAAGRGERAGAEGGPKQYRKLGTETVLQKTIRAFAQHDAVACVQVVIHADDHALYAASVTPSPKLLTPVNGGATRQASVMAGLKALENNGHDFVLIHDAARPFIQSDLIDRVLHGLETHPAVLPGLSMVDTVKRVGSDGMIGQTVPREDLFAAQTPQGFHFTSIFNAHQKASHSGKSDLTDDSSVAEWAGLKVLPVAGCASNIKLTTPEDFKDISNRMSIPDIRVGHGYDTHQLVAGDHVWLCGVRIPHTAALSGHSDADVGLHALTDALLASIADGDIGSHFPPTDPKWKGARSDQFLEYAVDRVRKAGGTITHMDVTLICEAPKIGPHRDKMRQTVAEIADVEIGRVAVKATTNERIGFIGREEGIVATATATVVMGSSSHD
jgi:2-C-methyl-D-erythritol 4-phosphate cytidylyltransferase/2-C-methyl-D-erythritol 2,4-cyclodiphosphate synthase